MCVGIRQIDRVKQEFLFLYSNFGLGLYVYT